MPSDIVVVGFKYRIVDHLTNAVLSEKPMELRAGFIGAEEDTKTHTLTPKIGWLVNDALSEEEIKEKQEKKGQWIPMPDDWNPSPEN
jgi:hypothetical protein